MANKGQDLADAEGFDDLWALVEEVHMDSVVPGICMNDECDYTSWYENGQMAEKGRFGQDGMARGLFTTWNPDGSIQLKIRYENGQAIIEEGRGKVVEQPE